MNSNAFLLQYPYSTLIDFYPISPKYLTKSSDPLFRRHTVHAHSTQKLISHALSCSVLANVHGDIVSPFPDRPTEGFFYINVELSPMASQNFETGRPSSLSIELAKMIDRSIRDCRAFDTEALAIISGEKVWAIYCDVHVVDCDGNLTDAVQIAAIAALMHFRRPDFSVDLQKNNGNVQNVDTFDVIPLSLHHIPLSVSFCYISNQSDIDKKDGAPLSPIFFIDPTDREEKVMDGTISFTFNSFRELCAVHKNGGAPISTDDILRCAQIAAARVGELVSVLKEEERKADQVASARHRSKLRGRDFVDISSIHYEQSTADIIQVDLGDLTDFRKMHMRIPIGGNEANDENCNEHVSSMAELLQVLEMTTGIQANTEMVDESPRKAHSVGINLSSTSKAEFAASVNDTQTDSSRIKDTFASEDSSEEDEPMIVESEFASRPVAKPLSNAKSESSEEEDHNLLAAVRRNKR